MLYIGCDHAALELKLEMLESLKGRGVDFVDLGTHTGERIDYTDFAVAVCRRVQGEPGAMGILFCGTGIGMSMAANKHAGIRAAVCTDTYSARMTRAHNDCNVLCLGARVVGAGLCEDIIATFLNTAYEGGRHQARVDAMAAIEAQRLQD